MQKEEISALNAVYTEDIKILKSQFPFKVQVNVRPYLEHLNLVFPWDYPDPFISMIVDMGKEYPNKRPVISFFSNQKGILKTGILDTLQKKFKANFKNKGGEFLLFELIERVREELLNITKATFSQRKIRYVWLYL